MKYHNIPLKLILYSLKRVLFSILEKAELSDVQLIVTEVLIELLVYIIKLKMKK